MYWAVPIVFCLWFGPTVALDIGVIHGLAVVVAVFAGAAAVEIMER